MKTYYVYVLRSHRDRQFYTGYTRDLERRLEEHNRGLVPSTKNRIPLMLVYWEGCLNQQDATRRERYLKSAWGKRYLKNRLKNYLTGCSPREIFQMRAFYIYVRKSSKDQNFYTGYTTDLGKRLEEHNKGLVPSTKNRIPFDLIYWEGCLNQKDATTRESYLKTAWGKRYIKNRLRNYLTG